MFQRASPEKYDPVAEDTALGLSLWDAQRHMADWAWKGEGPSSHIRPFVAPVALFDVFSHHPAHITAPCPVQNCCKRWGLMPLGHGPKVGRRTSRLEGLPSASFCASS